MKRLLAIMMVIMLLCGTLTAVTGITIFANEENTQELWSPVEITLTSSKDYNNPYLDTEIDAVFTHSDGTKISLPGFWKEGKTWAVRFSPTKVGKWEYVITCKDTSNTGLTKTGVINAVASTSDTEIARRGFVTTVKDQHYYQYADGTPFFWLGDTNWQAFSNVSTTVCNYPGCTCSSQFKHIVDDRIDKGFTVYQTYFVPGAGNGEKSIWNDGRYEKPNTEVFNEKVDYMFEYLGEQGMVIALGLGCHNSTMKTMKLDAFLRFTRYIVARYACYSIVWITGQEITDLTASITSGYTAFDCYFEAAELVEELDGYKHPNSAHMYPMNSTDARAIRLDMSDWHDSWTLQGGHGATVKLKTFYGGYYKTALSGFTKPFIEGEVNYEDINCGGFTGYDANRMSAWKAMTCGAAGFTYGVTGIWANCFSTRTFTGWYDGESSYNYEPWYMGLDKPGSYEMYYMKEFFLDLGNWWELIPQYTNTAEASFLDREACTYMRTEDKAVAIAYFYAGDQSTGIIRSLDETKTYTAYWFNPLTGKYIKIEENIKPARGMYTVPEKPTTLDWAFVITSQGLGDHYEEAMPSDLNEDYSVDAPTGNKVTPVSVKAIGGITYKGSKKAEQTMTDNTLWLYDGDPSTVWVPSANRTSQTFLFDLGSAQQLSHITIGTVKGTIIPRFRVEGSNDGKTWTIITNTDVRKADNPGSAGEPLSGTYRYVKVLLLNADAYFSKGGTDADKYNYKTMYNPHTESLYSVTEITDVVIYSNGEGTATKETYVANTLPEKYQTMYETNNGATGGDPSTDVTIGAVNGQNLVSNRNLIITITAYSVAGIVVAMTVVYFVTGKKKEQ